MKKTYKSLLTRFTLTSFIATTFLTAYPVKTITNASTTPIIPALGSTALSKTGTYSLYRLGNNLTGSREVEFDVIPAANQIDGVIGYAGYNSSVSTIGDLGAILRLNSSGFFDVYNWDNYQALTQVPYQANNKYSVRMSMDMDHGTYDVYVKSPASSVVASTLTDDCSTFLNVYSRTNWSIDSNTKSTFKRGSSAENVVYNLNNINNFQVAVKYQYSSTSNNKSVLERYKFYVSQDNVTYTAVSAKVKDGTLNQKDTSGLDSSATLTLDGYIPEGMNYFKIVTTAADTNIWSAQIDNISITGTDKPISNQIKDSCTDLTKVSSSTNIALDTGRFKRASTDKTLTGNVVYKVNDITDFAFSTWYNFGTNRSNTTDILTRVKAYVSPDGSSSTYIPITLKVKPYTQNQFNSWNLDNTARIIPAAAIPAGMNYLKLELNNNDAVVYSPTFDDVVVTGKEKPGVSVLTDDCTDFTKVFSKTGWTIDSGTRFKRSTTVENVIYKSKEISDFAVKLMYNYGASRNNTSDVLSRVNLYVSPDNITYTPVTAVIKEGSLDQKADSFNLDSSAVLVPGSAIPAGMNYLKIETTDKDTVAWSPQIDSVSVTGITDTSAVVEQPYVKIAEGYSFAKAGLKDIGKIVLSGNTDGNFRIINHNVGLYQNLTPTDDAYVQAGDTAGTNFGKATGIVVRMPDQRRGYLKFDLSQLRYQNNYAYDLRLYADPATHTKGNITYAYGVPDDNWNENTINFNNSPNPSGLFTDTTKALSSVVMNKNGLYLTWPVTDFIKQELGGDRVATIEINGDQWEWTQLNSKEADINWPELRAYYTAKDALGALLNESNNLYNGAVEGSENNEYAVGSKAVLKQQIDVSALVLGNANTSQSEMLVSLDDLNNSLQQFKFSRVGVQINKVNSFAEKYVLLPGETTAMDTSAVLNEGTKLTSDQATITYSSSDEAVLRVDANGGVTAAGYGTASIISQVKYGNSVMSTQVPIVVKKLTVVDLKKAQDIKGSISTDESYDILLDLNRDKTINDDDISMIASEVTRVAKMDAKNTDLAFMLGYGKVSVKQQIQLINNENPAVKVVAVGDIITLPAKFVAENLGATVTETTNPYALNIDYNGRKIVLTEGSTEIKVDSSTTVMSVSATKVNDTLMVSAASLANAFGKLTYSDDSGIVIISDVNYTKVEDNKYIEDLIFNISGERYWTYLDGRDSIDLNQIKKDLQLTPITASMVSNAFNNRDLANVHPRTVINQAGIDRIKQLRDAGDPYITKSLKALISSADSTLTMPLPVWATDGLRYTTIHDRTYKIADLAFAYLFTGDKRYLDKGYADAEAICNFKDWNISGHALDTGVAAGNLAVFYDMVYNDLTSAQRKVIENAMIKNAITPGLAAMKNRVWWSVDANNWTGIVDGGIMTGALAMYDLDPQTMSDTIATAMNGMADKYIRAFEPAGQNEEGIMYWGYGLMFATMAFQSLEQVLGTDFGYTDTQGLRKTGFFPIYTSGPAAGLSIGDDPLKDSPSSTKVWFSYRYNDPALAAAAYNPSGNADWRDFLFYNPDLVQKGLNDKSAQAPLDNFMPGTDLIGFRSAWDYKATYIGIHGGRNSASHGHLDAGAFDVQANGKVWVNGGLGRDDYNFPGYFENNANPGYLDSNTTTQMNAARWDFYMLRTEGKSAIVINGNGQPDIRPEQNPNGAAVVEKIISKPKGAITTMDLTSAYSRDTEHYKRGIMLSNDRKIITIQDEIKTKNPNSKVWWLANIKPDRVQIAADGRSAILYMGNERMWVGIASPTQGQFKVMNAGYLPGESFPMTKNTAVAHKKLYIELNNVSETTITVNFVPLETWQSAPEISLPPVKAMDNWSIDDGSMPESKVRPVLTDLKINGKTVDGFSPNTFSYNYITAVDDTRLPTIVGTSDANIEQSIDGNKVMLLLTDKTDPNNKNAYFVSINRIQAPQSGIKLNITGVTAIESSATDRTINPAATIDGNADGSVDRWSSSGNGRWIKYELGEPQNVDYLAMACFSGEKRKLFFSVETSVDGESWTQVYSGESSGTTSAFEYYKLQSTNARYVKIIGNGNSVSAWNSISEVELYRDKEMSVSLSSDKTELRLADNDEALLSVQAVLEDGTAVDLSDAIVTYKSSDDGIARVDASGKVTAVAVGTASITVTVVKNGKVKTSQMDIHIVNPLASVRISCDKTKLKLADSASLTVEGTLEDGTKADLEKASVSYRSSNEEVARVDASGNVTPTGLGTATITAEVVLDGVTKSARIDMQVVNSLSSVSLTLDKATLKLVETAQPSVTGKMANGSDADLTNAVVAYESDNTAIVTITSDNKVKPVGVGIANVKVTVILDSVVRTATAQVRVTNLLSELNVNSDKTQLILTDSASLTIEGTLEDGTKANLEKASVSYRSSNEEVARVDASGNVTPTGLGTATITAEVVLDGVTKSARIDMKVVNSLSSVSLTLDKSTLKLMETAQPSVTGKMANGADADLTNAVVAYESDNTAVVTITSDNIVKPVGVGTAIVKVTVILDSIVKTATAQVKVTNLLSEISMSIDESELKLSDKGKLTVQGWLENGSTIDTTKTTVSYISSNENVVKVDVLGNVIPIGLGTAQITAKVVLEGVAKTAVVDVKVINSLASVSVSSDKTELKLFDTAQLSAAGKMADGTAADLLNSVVNYTSSNEAVVKVDAYGKVSPQAVGSAKISIAVTMNSIVKTAEIEIKVTNYLKDITVSLDHDKNNLKLKDITKIMVQGILEDDTKADLTEAAIAYGSDNEEVAKVDESGNIIPVSKGTANITVVVNLDGIEKSSVIEVTVKQVKLDTKDKHNKDIFADIKGKNEEIIISDNSIQWTFKGTDITTNNFKDIDLSLKTVSEDLKNKMSDKVKSVSGKVQEIVPFSINYDGYLPGKAEVKLFVNKAWAGKTVNVSRYFEDRNTYSIVDSAVVDSEGYIIFSLDHCSDYFVSQAVLPKTGTMVDMNTLLAFGFALVAAGALAFGRRRSNVKR